MATHSQSTLFHRLGGPVGMRQIVDDLYRRLLEDTALAPDFAGADLRELRRRQYEMLAIAMGGHGSELVRLPTTAAVGLAAGDEHYDRALAHLVDTLDAFGTDREAIDEVLDILIPLHPAIATA